jgi:O-antigen ligase
VFIIVSWSVSALVSDFPIQALEASLRTGIFLGAAVLFHAALLEDQALATQCLKTLIILTLVGASFALISSTVWPEIYWTLRLKGLRATPLQTEFKGYSALIVLVTPLLLIGLWRLGTLWRVTSAVGIIQFAVITWMSSNRSALAGVFVMAMAFSVAQIFRPAYRKIAVGVAGVFIVILGSVVASLHTSRIKIATTRAPEVDWLFPVWLIDFQRQTIWSFTLKIWERAPWLGVGPNTINFSPGANAPLPGDEQLHIIPGHPHNWAVELLAETGSIGFLMLVIAIGYIGYRWTHWYVRSGDIAIMGALLIFAGYWGSGLFNFSYWSAWWQLSFFMACAIALSHVRKTENSASA